MSLGVAASCQFDAGPPTRGSLLLRVVTSRVCWAVAAGNRGPGSGVGVTETGSESPCPRDLAGFRVLGPAVRWRGRVCVCVCVCVATSPDFVSWARPSPCGGAVGRGERALAAAPKRLLFARGGEGEGRAGREEAIQGGEKRREAECEGGRKRKGRREQGMEGGTTHLWREGGREGLTRARTHTATRFGCCRRGG